MNTREFEGRKKEHIQLALSAAHQATGLGGLDRIRLVHEALPELDFEEVLLESTILGRPSPKPFYVAGMTAGHPDAPALNLLLAEACQERGWAMGVGSQRRELDGASTDVDAWKAFRKAAPKLKLLANVGVSQLITAPLDRVRRLVDSIEADALVVHLNALQEAIQPEGTPRFKGGLAAIERACRELGAPVVLKETGCGFSGETLRRLRETGLAAVDVSGLGGTHWGRIEGARAPEGSPQAVAAATFAEWGEPTAEAVLAARRELAGPGRRTEVWASGGVRTGLDAAKLIALGASQAGFAKPALEAALAGGDQLRKWMEAREFELRVALFCTGCASPAALRDKEEKWKANAI